MKYWITNEEMGEGFIYDTKVHKHLDYNELISIETHEANTRRTKYLIRDVWSIEQLKDLQEYLNEYLEEKEEEEYDEDREAREYEGGKEDYLYDNYVADQLEERGK
tara:strand:- start:1160 stop:1477 length:318 start_codon:yes stop_codon:yes gene_type:complete